MIAVALRVARIVLVLFKHRLDDLLIETPFGRWRWLLRPLYLAGDNGASRGERLRSALEELGPIFVKFGQILSTRRDLLAPDLADALALLRDRVAPFPGAEARRIVEAQLGQPILALFDDFDETPLASASIAQVHAARLKTADGSGRVVVVKVVRPGIDERIAADLILLKALAEIATRTHPRADKIRPHAVVAEIETTLRAELDLQREGANASVLRRNWLDSDDLYVPEVIWSHSAERVLTMERVYGIPSDDIDALDAAGISRPALSEKGVRVFYTQVFRDNFFHADAHAGNIWVDPDPARRDNPRFIALDFGIMGQLSIADQYYVAENFMAIFRHDYRRIAELHIEAGWMPQVLRIDELEAETRAVCESYFARPAAELSFGEVLLRLFRIAQRHQLTLQPQLILLQKTLLNIEGVARHINPRLDIWKVARPVLERILADRYSPRRLRQALRVRLPEMIARAPEFPRLIHAFFEQQVAGRQQFEMRSADLAAIAKISARGQRATIYAIFGAGLLITAALMYVFEAGGPAFGDLPAATWIAGGLALACFIAAWPRWR